MSAIRPTKYPELGFVHTNASWRFVDMQSPRDTSAGPQYPVVGPQYATKEALLADLDSYHQRAGWGGRCQGAETTAYELEVMGGSLDKGFYVRFREEAKTGGFMYSELGHMACAQLFKEFPRRPEDMVGRKLRMVVEVL